MNDLKKELKARFSKLFPDKRLLAIQLNGFTHTVFYDEKSPRAKVTNYSSMHYSSCMSNEEARGYGMNSDKLVVLFAGVPNYSYQNNAEEIIYVRP